MKIELKSKVNFSFLEAGDFFICDGDLYLKIVEESEGYNVVNLSKVQKKQQSLYCFPGSRECRKCDGTIEVY